MDNRIIINNFQKGVNPNPSAGFEAIVNCDINTNLGTIYPNFTPSKESGTNFTELVVAMAGNYALDENGTIATFDGDVIPDRPSNYDKGLAWWKGYLFHIGYSHINTWKDGVGWADDWDGDSKEGSSVGFSYVAMNDKLYIASGRFLYSLEEVAGKTFDPTDNTTFTAITKALDLPDGYVIKAISEVGEYLAILANKGANGALFLWDKHSVSFDTPILFNERGNQIIAYNGLLYLNMGYQCSFYISNGSSVAGPYKFPLSSLENTINNLLDFNLTFRPNAIDIIRDKIFFGLEADSYDMPQGIYSFDPKTKIFQCENIISTKTVTRVKIGVIKKIDTSSPYSYRYGFSDETSGANAFGVDKVAATARVSNYKAYFITQFYNVGTKLQPRTFQKIQFKFRKPANGGEYNVRIACRKDRKYNTWTTINTTELNDTNLIVDYEIPFTVTAPSIQFKVSFDGNSDTVAELQEIIII